MCQDFIRGTCVHPRPHAQADKIRVAQTRLFSPAEWDMSPVAYYRASLVHFMGACVGEPSPPSPWLACMRTAVSTYASHLSRRLPAPRPPHDRAGTIWGTSRAGVDGLFSLFTETCRYMLARGAVDQDQAVIAHMFKRRPEAFDSFYTVQRWDTVLQDF